MRLKFAIVFLCLISCYSTYAQTVKGSKGYFHVPSAEFFEDGTLHIGAGYIPKGYFEYYGRYRRAGIPTYLSCTIFPFLELVFGYNHLEGVKIEPSTRPGIQPYFPDRFLNLKLRVLKEKKFIPALSFGFNDVSSLLLPNNNRNEIQSSTFILVSKNFDLGNFELDTSVGYGSNFLGINPIVFDGFFGGAQLKSKKIKNLSVVFENDGSTYNFGIKLNLIDRLNFGFGSWDFKKPTFLFSYKLKLID